MKSANVVMMRDIEAWLHCNFDAISDETFSAAYQAWLSCKMADRPDNANAACQMMHKATMAQFLGILVR